jgi:hypothetical protein
MKRELGMGVTGLVTLGIAAWAILPSEVHGGRGGGGVIYVTSQGLFYDTFATKDPLPPNGPFQLLVMGPNGPETEFGPGDVGYLGGRWMEDFDGDGELHYFLCPLLPPGRESP